jgi:CRISPR/Cas system-associated protein Cas5 (RAMP superfamily)
LRLCHHINNTKSDNNVDNLRWASKIENSQNTIVSSKNTSGIKGISWQKNAKKWEVYISIDKQRKYLGLFDNIEDAKKARQEYANKIFGEFTNACEKIIHLNVNININVNQELLELEELEKELERIMNL